MNQILIDFDLIRAKAHALALFRRTLSMPLGAR
jgi:hypothetical protein